jgi:hypothetical protein
MADSRNRIELRNLVCFPWLLPQMQIDLGLARRCDVLPKFCTRDLHLEACTPPSERLRIARDRQCLPRGPD